MAEAAHSGWKQEETLLLEKELANAQHNGEPLRPAFERVAEKTGRKAGSIRNYYYTTYRKQKGENINRTFEPFSKEEIDALLAYMLRQSAQGKSVRRAAMELGNFDHSAMLRYQNKYRSLLKNRPDLVREAAEKLRKNGEQIQLPASVQGMDPAATHALDDLQTKKILGHLWQNLERKLMDMPRQQALCFVQGLWALMREVQKDTDVDVTQILQENAQLKRENIGLIRQLEMMQTPCENDAMYHFSTELGISVSKNDE